jgi:hypothetical protein
VVDGAVVDQVVLTAERPDGELTLTTGPAQLVELQSDRVFSPGWHTPGDPRVLSFMLDSPT